MLYWAFNIFTGLALLSGHLVIAQNFQKFYSFENAKVNWVDEIKVVNDGILVVGGVTPMNSDSFEMVISKMDFNGNVLFYKKIGGKRDELRFSIGKTGKNIIVSGYTQSFPINKNSNFLIYKLNEFGDTIFSRAYGGNDHEPFEKNSLVPLAKDHFILGGSTSSVRFGNLDAHIVRFDSIGNILWARTIGGSLQERLKSSILFEDFLYCSGNTSSPEWAKGSDGMVIKMTLDGDTIWTKIYNNHEVENYDGIDIFDGIDPAENGNILLVGNKNSPEVPNYLKGFILKINSDGDTLWSREIAGVGYNYLYRSITTPHGHYIIGETHPFSAVDTDGLLVKLSLSGDLLWAKAIGDTTHDYLKSGGIDSLGNLYLAGHSTDGNRSILIKTDTTFENKSCYFKDIDLEFRKLNTVAKRISPQVLDTILPVYNTNSTVEDGFQTWDILCDVGLEEIENKTDFIIYPNPFSDRINIMFPEIKSKEIKIEIIEIATGRVLISKEMGKENVSFSTEGIASGVYLARLMEGSRVLFWEKVVCVRE